MQEAPVPLLSRATMPSMIAIEDICEPEWAAWYRMTPQERRHRVAHLLMDGQACVLYGAAEFSRDLASLHARRLSSQSQDRQPGMWRQSETQSLKPGKKRLDC